MRGLLAVAVSALLAAPPARAGLAERLRGGPRAAGHQGSLFGAKNTVAGFDEALRAGADIVEMDLRLSRDGVPVVFHDAWMGLWTHCLGFVRDMSAAQITACRYRGSGTPVPTFAEVLDWARGRVIVNAEFKTVEVIAPALALARAKGALGWTYFQTQWDPEKYYRARALDKDAILQFQPWTLDRLDWALARKDPNLLVIELNELTWDSEHLRRVHAAGKLASVNSFYFSWSYELSGAACSRVWARDIDIAVSNRPKDCAAQRDAARPATSAGTRGR
ncbi:MAG TPA: glycerophosphodiester phosphodiesterase family protein [Elusimicrobiota bacterium]|jgi:glycerophosphoryl diester phosphodiesterase|nr:glycerophosphodiester phosphodiesterase family protein [Elusimicrobiota bacterium]